MNYVKLLILLILSIIVSAGCSKVSENELDEMILPGLCMAFECHKSTQLKIYPPVSGLHREHSVFASSGPRLGCRACHYNYYYNPLHKNGFVNGYNWIYKLQTAGSIVYWNKARYPTAVWDDAANSCSGLPASTCHDSRIWATCKSCHVNAPLSQYPPASGAHTVHLNQKYKCQVCHMNYTGQATHNNGTVDGFNWQTRISTNNAVTIVIFNTDLAGSSASYSHGQPPPDIPPSPSGNCANINCHPSTTKNWYWYTEGCTVCHQYEPLNQAYPNSGRHQEEGHAGQSCTTCHYNYASGNALHNNGTINGSAFDPKATAAGTIVNFTGGGSFNSSTGGCSGISCHGTENWYSGGDGGED